MVHFSDLSEEDQQQIFRDSQRQESTRTNGIRAPFAARLVLSRMLGHFDKHSKVPAANQMHSPLVEEKGVAETLLRHCSDAADVLRRHLPKADCCAEPWPAAVDSWMETRDFDEHRGMVKALRGIKKPLFKALSMCAWQVMAVEESEAGELVEKYRAEGRLSYDRLQMAVALLEDGLKTDLGNCKEDLDDRREYIIDEALNLPDEVVVDAKAVLEQVRHHCDRNRKRIKRLIKKLKDVEQELVERYEEEGDEGILVDSDDDEDEEESQGNEAEEEWSDEHEQYISSDSGESSPPRTRSRRLRRTRDAVIDLTGDQDDDDDGGSGSERPTKKQRHSDDDDDTSPLDKADIVFDAEDDDDRDDPIED
jgi:hypothetical protein